LQPNFLVILVHYPSFCSSGAAGFTSTNDIGAIQI